MGRLEKMWQAFSDQGVDTILVGCAGVLFLTQMMYTVVKKAYEKARDQLLRTARTPCRRRWLFRRRARSLFGNPTSSGTVPGHNVTS